MRSLKQYGGILLILIAVGLLAATFFTEKLQEDPGLNHVVLGVSAALVVVGIICLILGGKIADKIGGE